MLAKSLIRSSSAVNEFSGAPAERAFVFLGRVTPPRGRLKSNVMLRRTAVLVGWRRKRLHSAVSKCDEPNSFRRRGLASFPFGRSRLRLAGKRHFAGLGVEDEGADRRRWPGRANAGDGFGLATHRCDRRREAPSQRPSQREVRSDRCALDGDFPPARPGREAARHRAACRLSQRHPHASLQSEVLRGCCSHTLRSSPTYAFCIVRRSRNSRRASRA